MKLMVFSALLMTFFSSHAETIRVGMLPNEPPFSIEVGKNNLFSGFEAQLIAELCKRLEAHCIYVPLQFKDFFPQLLENKIDIAIGQISITLDREKQFLFTLPYLVTNGQFITTKGSTIKNIEDIQGKSIGVFKASLYKDYVLRDFDKETSVKEYDSSLLAFQALMDGKVDGLLLSTIAEKYWIANSNFEMSSFRFIGRPIPLGNGYGIMANLQSNELIQKINKILIAMQSDGTYIQIYNLYFGLVFR